MEPVCIVFIKECVFELHCFIVRKKYSRQTDYLWQARFANGGLLKLSLCNYNKQIFLNSSLKTIYQTFCLLYLFQTFQQHFILQRKRDQQVNCNVFNCFENQESQLSKSNQMLTLFLLKLEKRQCSSKSWKNAAFPQVLRRLKISKEQFLTLFLSNKQIISKIFISNLRYV